MRAGAVIAGVAAGLALMAAAEAAAAQTAPRSRAPALTLSEASAARSVAPATAAPSRLRVTERGRWGVDFNLSQPVGRESDLGDVQAGAYYRVNPRLRVGASAGLAAQETDPARAPETDRRAAPRFRLESIFRF